MEWILFQDQGLFAKDFSFFRLSLDYPSEYHYLRMSSSLQCHFILSLSNLHLYDEKHSYHSSRAVLFISIVALSLMTINFKRQWRDVIYCSMFIDPSMVDGCSVDDPVDG